MKILAIETSCDETAIAIIEIKGLEKKPKIFILSNIVSSQVKLHAKFGGVVPNLAKREHQKSLVPILLQALQESRIQNLESRRPTQKVLNSRFQILDSILEREPELLNQFIKKILPLKTPDIDAVAVTYGPGLAPALWVGLNFAKALSHIWKKPLIPINHMAGHLYSSLLQSSNRITNYKLQRTPIIRHSSFVISHLSFPALALLVSGGHTELVLMRGHGKYKILGETVDDAAGEAFDKVARILGLKYPGGPEISRLAEARNKKQETRIKLPRPMINSKDYNFSFSGLKTAALYLVRDLGAKRTRELRPAIAKEFQDAVVEVLVKKTIRAIKEFKIKTVLLGGGVAANKKLRNELTREVKSNFPNSLLLIPDSLLTGDNALMIALAAYFQAKPGSNSSAAAKSGKTRSGRRLLPGNKKTWNKVQVDANLKL